MLVFAGLGNPGPEHAHQRHNIGFMAADAIARRHSFSPWSKKFQGLIAEGKLGDEKVLLLKPQTYMNRSGEAVAAALRFYKLEPAHLTVFYDELDLAPCKVRIKTGGGAGGHNGIRSIDGHLGQAYRRVRIGIGHPGNKDFVLPHVLGNFTKADAVWTDPLLEAIASEAPLLVAGDESGFMNKLTLSTNAERSQAPKPRAQSHIRQARPAQPDAQLPETGPMAAMLKKLLGKH